MTPLLFRCMACDFGPRLRSFPLCVPCETSLLPAPRLCCRCASPICEGVRDPRLCPAPGAFETAIESYSAAYLLIEPGYSVLKKWKTRGGPFFDRRILKPERLPRETRRSRNTVVIPVPQRIERSWRLNRSPALRVAKWLSTGLRLPLIDALEASGPSTIRQAELKLSERRQNPLRYEWKNSFQPEPGTSIILVDDFMTTGHTLRAAARTLQSRGGFRVHAFCLGVRAQRIQKPHTIANLVKGA